MIESVTGGSPYNLVSTAFVERGVLDVRAFEEAVGATVARHEGLRTVFAEGDAGIVRVVLDDQAPDLTGVVHDGDPAGFDDYVRTTPAAEARSPFDLLTAPAVRFLHFASHTGRQAVVLIAHHMVLDGLPVGLVLTEVFERYAGKRDFGAGTPLRALIRHQEQLRTNGVRDDQAEFWAAHLAGCPSVLELPADQQHPPVQDAAGERARRDLGPVVSTAIRARSRASGVTTFALLLAAFGLTLSRTTGARSLLVGVPLGGGPRARLPDHHRPAAGAALGPPARLHGAGPVDGRELDPADREREGGPGGADGLRSPRASGGRAARPPGQDPRVPRRARGDRRGAAARRAAQAGGLRPPRGRSRRPAPRGLRRPGDRYRAGCRRAPGTSGVRAARVHGAERRRRPR